jgi:hypothetical protein
MRVVCLIADSVDFFTFGRVYEVVHQHNPSVGDFHQVYDDSGGCWHVRKDHKSGHWIISGRPAYTFEFAEVEE